jgi:hypothetical protein
MARLFIRVWSSQFPFLTLYNAREWECPAREAAFTSSAQLAWFG